MIGHDVPDSAARRAANRDAHVSHVQVLHDAGRIALAGPMRDDQDQCSIGAVIVFEAASLAEAREIAARDPYVRGGVFEKLVVAPFHQAYPAHP